MYPGINIEYIFFKIYEFFANFGVNAEGVIPYWNTYVSIATYVSLILIGGIIYTIIRLKQVEKEIEEKWAPTGKMKQSAAQVQEKKWEQIMDHVMALNPNDWRLAVLEADVLLDQALQDAGFPGDTLGDRLKAAGRTGFRSVNQAWEAHKVRNSIAHAGSDFILTQREARRIIDLYRQVLEEFNVIS